MLFEVSSLVEAHQAICVWTQKGFLSRMDSQMSVEFTDAPKCLLAFV